MAERREPVPAQPFVGRKAELDELVSCWREAKGGRTRLALLLGGSGLGKTRLVQELYGRLSAEEDPNDYWPPFMPSETKNSLAVAPTIASVNSAVPIPWLRWGLRCDDPHGRQAIQGEALVVGGKQLEYHLFAITRAKLRNADNAVLFKSIAGGLLDVTAGLATGGLLPVGPGILINAWDAAVAEHRKRQRARDDPGGEARLFEQQRQATLVDQARGFLRSVFNAREPGLRSIPIVLIVDNAMWADPLTIDFVRQSLEEGAAQGWPLLVVATCWEYALREQLADSGADRTSIAALIRDLRGGYLDRDGALLREISIDILSDDARRQIIGQALPTLDDDHAALLAERSGGNALLLWELIYRLQRERRGITADLIRALPSDLLNAVRDRFDALPDALRDVLCWGSGQGIRFYAELVERVRQARLAGPGLDTAELLRRADDPHNWVQYPVRAGNAELSEFRQQIYYDVARGCLDPTSEEPVVLAQLYALLKDWHADGKLLRLPPGDREGALRRLAELARKQGDVTTAVDALGELVMTLTATRRPFEAAGSARELVDIVETRGDELVMEW